MKYKLNVLFKLDISKALARTFIARVISQLGNLFLGIILARLYGAEGVGIFSLAQSILIGVSIFSRYGMDSAIMMYVGRDQLQNNVYCYLLWGSKKTLVISFIILPVIFICRHWIETTFSAPQLANVLLGTAIAIPAFSISYLLSGFMKGIKKPATASMLENGSISLLSSILLIILNYFHPEFGITNSGFALAIAAWVICLHGGWQTWHWCIKNGLHNKNNIEKEEIAQFKTSSHSFFIFSLSGFMQTTFSIMITGYMLNITELGLFRAAQQMAVLISFVLIVLNAVFPPRFAALYHQKKFQELEKLVRTGSIMGLIAASPFLFICIFFPELILTIFGTEFIAAATLLQIIAVGQLINVATGSVGLLLNMTDHVKLMRNISLTCNAIGLLLFSVLIYYFGTIGAAIAFALTLILQNLVGVFYVWRTLGIWTLPTPNIFSILDYKKNPKI